MDEIRQIFDSFHIDPYLLYETIVNSTEDYVYIIDMTKDLALVSESMLEDFNLPGRVVPGLVGLWGQLVHDRDKARYHDSINRMLCGETDLHNEEYQILNRKNEYIWVVCRGQLKRGEDGSPILFAGVVTSIGSKGKIDYLTGLFTQMECERLIDRLLQEKREGGVLLLGLDDFAQINTLNSHIFGNSVLRQFAQTVQRYLPPESKLFRFDGDEFAIVCEGYTGQDIYELYQKIHAYCNRWHEVDGISYSCTASGGITMINANSGNSLDVVKYASSALEASKRRGKNICTFFSPDLIKPRLRQMEISNRLQLSVLHNMDQFMVVYQPLVQADTLKLCGAEALLRWSCEALGSITPGEFIPLLESSNLIIPVGKWVIEQAVGVCKRWVTLCPDFVMNINISYLQLLDDTFISFINRILHKYDLAPDHIILEMTESYFVTDMNALQDTFRELRRLGIRIAMDDFGTGYSSLGLLSQSPADVVKIDRIFISAINHDDFNRSFIGSVINLCHSVGIDVCVEGVEENEELETVRSIHADSLQGFYFSCPLPAEEFERKYWP